MYMDHQSCSTVSSSICLFFLLCEKKTNFLHSKLFVNYHEVQNNEVLYIEVDVYLDRAVYHRNDFLMHHNLYIQVRMQQAYLIQPMPQWWTFTLLPSLRSPSISLCWRKLMLVRYIRNCVFCMAS